MNCLSKPIHVTWFCSCLQHLHMFMHCSFGLILARINENEIIRMNQWKQNANQWIVARLPMKVVFHASIKSHQVNAKHTHMPAASDVATHKIWNWYYLWYENETTFSHFFLPCYHADTHWESKVAKSLKKAVQLVWDLPVICHHNHSHQKNIQTGKAMSANASRGALTRENVPIVASSMMTTIWLMTFKATWPMT